MQLHGQRRSRDGAYLWTAAITNAIRAADPSRPVVSGMHSLCTPHRSAGPFPEWTIDDQGELTDLLTTHPYPYWTRHTRSDAVNTLRTTLHATAETRFYADIGGFRAREFVLPVGQRLPGVPVVVRARSDRTRLRALRLERGGTELGLLRNDGSAKPVLREMAASRAFLDGLPLRALPPRRTDGVCLLTRDQDDWAAAFGAFVLGKQAGLEMEFRHIMQPIPDAGLYLLPSIAGPSCVPRRRWLELLTRVRAGATLYVSLGDGIVPHFNEVAGVELVSRAKPPQPLATVLDGVDDSPLPMDGADDLRFVPRGAEVLGVRPDTRSPVFWRHRLGAGWVVVFASPLEVGVTLRPGAFDAAPPYWRVYDEVRKTGSVPRALILDCPAVAMTEHRTADGRTVVVIINHTAVEQKLVPKLGRGFALGETGCGATISPRVPRCFSIALRCTSRTRRILWRRKPCVSISPTTASPCATMRQASSARVAIRWKNLAAFHDHLTDRLLTPLPRKA